MKKESENLGVVAGVEGRKEGQEETYCLYVVLTAKEEEKRGGSLFVSSVQSFGGMESVLVGHELTFGGARRFGGIALLVEVGVSVTTAVAGRDDEKALKLRSLGLTRRKEKSVNKLGMMMIVAGCCKWALACTGAGVFSRAFAT